MAQEKDYTDLDNEEGMTELMKAHLDDVAGGARHNSWKQSSVADQRE